MTKSTRQSPPLSQRRAGEIARGGGVVFTIAATALAIAPLALIPDVFISHDVIPKVILLNASAAFLLFLFEQWKPLLSDLWRLTRGKFFLFLVAAQILSLLLSTSFSGQIPLSLGGTVWRRFGLIEQTATLIIATALSCHFAAHRLDRAWIHTRLFRIVGLCGGLTASYGIFQYFGVDPFLQRSLYALSYFGGVARPPATMGHAIYFSAYLTAVLFIAAAGALGDPVRRWRSIQTFMAILCAIAIVLSATRSAMAGALAGGVLFARNAIGRRFRARPLQYAGVAVAALAIVTGFVASPAGTNLRNRMGQWREDFGGPRFQMWRECAGLIARRPILGEGPDRFAGEFRKVQSAELSQRYPDFYNETPHNAFIDAACAQGVPGLLILSAMIFLAWGRESPRAPGMPGDSFDPVQRGLKAALLGLVVSSLFTSLTLVALLYLWSIAGLLVALYPGAAQALPRREIRIPTVPLMVCGSFLLATAAMLGLQDSAWAALRRAVAAKDLNAAQEAWKRANSWAHGLPGYELWASREFTILGGLPGSSPDTARAWKLATESAALAEVRSEDQASAAWQSAILAIAAGDVTRAESKARDTIQLAPNWYRGHSLLGRILEISGRNAEAKREAALSLALSEVCRDSSRSIGCSTTKILPDFRP